jgi:alkylation response protein AidB-like acyl-CoA dehydrogenase
MTQDVTALAESEARLQSIKSAAKNFLSTEWSPAHFRSAAESTDCTFSPDLWQKVVELGWPTVLAPDTTDEEDRDVVAFCGLQEELGAALAPVPLAASVIATTVPHRSSGETGASLPGSIATPVLVGSEPTSGWMPSVEGARRGYRLSIRGNALFVPYAPHADQLLLPINLGPQQTALARIESKVDGLSISHLKTLDWSCLGEAILDDVSIGASEVIAEGSRADELHRDLIDLHVLTTAAELLGNGREALNLAVEYARTRVAFGRPIGSFQAIKHRLVDLHCDIEVARGLIYGAAREMASESQRGSSVVAMAGFWSLDTLHRVPEGALQVFGGIGFTWEHDIHLFLRRAATLTAMLGERSYFRQNVIDGLKAN